MTTRTQAELAAIERDGQECLRCGRNLYGIPASVHHRLPRSAGTKAQVDRVENLTLLCGSGTTLCHAHVHANPRESYATGFLIRRGSDPASRPLLTQTGMMTMLLPDGTKVSDPVATFDDAVTPW